MIALSDRQQVTSACKPWCLRHDEGPSLDSLIHISQHVAFTTTEGQQVDAWLDMVEEPDGINDLRVQVDGPPELTSLSIADARMLADALNELITPSEAPA